MGITFAILKTIEGDDNQVFQYDEGVIGDRLPKLVLENLPMQTIFKKKYSRAEIIDAVNKAWDNLIKEFKQNTIKLK